MDPCVTMEYTSYTDTYSQSVEELNYYWLFLNTSVKDVHFVPSEFRYRAGEPFVVSVGPNQIRKAEGKTIWYNSSVQAKHDQFPITCKVPWF